MAEEALKKLENHLNCPVCLDTYTDPKQLQCHHVYCQQCLVRLVVRDQQGQLILTCPSCRQVTPVPASGVGGLQAAFQINQLLEIVEEHKRAKEVAASAGKVESVAISHNSQGNIPVCCPQHNGKKVALYCETCRETICYKCTKQGEKHHGHNYDDMDDAFERYKGEITSSLEPIEKQLTVIEKALRHLDARSEEISNQQATMEATIHDTIGRLHQMLDVRKTELISQLHRLTQIKLKSLAAQRDQVETTQAQLSSCLLLMKENLKKNNQEEALANSISRQVKELTTAFQPDILEPNAIANIIFSELVDITAVIQNYGRVHEKGLPDPSKCTASGKGLEVAAVGEKSTTLLQTLSFDNQPSKEAKNLISCELVSELTGTRVRGNIERRGQSQYEISYRPNVKGAHQLHIKVEGQHIRGSPFPVSARSSVEKLGTPILTISGMKGPMGVAVSQRGEAVVAENRGARVSVFSSSGERLRSFGTHGSSHGQFVLPCGVAVDGMGCILVTDKSNANIQKFTPEGEFITAVGTKGSGPLKFSEPCGIAYSAKSNKVYVVDRNGRLQILNSDLSYVASIGKKGSGKGQFNDPQLLACDSTGNVYVADCDNNRIQVFTAEGKFLRLIGRYGKGAGDLSAPCGLAVDSSGKVYVSELDNNRISVFTAEGRFVTSFGSKGRGAGQFVYPTGLAVADSGLVYVCDHSNNCLQEFY